MLQIMLQAELPKHCVAKNQLNVLLGVPMSQNPKAEQKKSFRWKYSLLSLLLLKNKTKQKKSEGGIFLS